MRLLFPNLLTTGSVARWPAADRDARWLKGRRPMPTPTADDPLRTTDHEPSVRTPTDGNTIILRPALVKSRK